MVHYHKYLLSFLLFATLIEYVLVGLWEVKKQPGR